MNTIRIGGRNVPLHPAVSDTDSRAILEARGYGRLMRDPRFTVQLLTESGPHRNITAPAPRRRTEHREVQCAHCGERFEALRSTAKYCSATCRSAGRQHANSTVGTTSMGASN